MHAEGQAVQSPITGGKLSGEPLAAGLQDLLLRA